MMHLKPSTPLLRYSNALFPRRQSGLDNGVRINENPPGLWTLE
jgi:hypothetical protein